ncbi:MAG: NAD-dependent epimerase/dehydratase family protein, partial [Bacteroidia bacterium]|nr:NAD-dependent epimerase/dehydratase family protein [Bacteroidia bacterium]
MKVIITGATGMVGEGILLACLENPTITEIVMINRRTFPLQNPKLKELIVSDFMKLENYSADFKEYDACFFCAGISSIGLKEPEYTHITYDITLNVAKVLADLNPKMVFTYVSGALTDSSEKGKSMWARVKGKTENDLMKLPFKGVYNFRPGFM